ncbi:unnamed protein product, partial [Urochloa humidicola]
PSVLSPASSPFPARSRLGFARRRHRNPPLLPLLLLHIRHHSHVRRHRGRRDARQALGPGGRGGSAAAITARLRIRRGTAMAGTSGPQIERSAWRRAALFLRRKRRTRRQVSLDCHSILACSASTFSGQQAKLERALAVEYSAPASSNPSPAGPMVVAATLDRLTRSAHVLLCIPSM